MLERQPLTGILPCFHTALMRHCPSFELVEVPIKHVFSSLWRVADCKVLCFVAQEKVVAAGLCCCAVLISVCMCHGAHAVQVENVNLSRLVNGHFDYLTAMDEILEVINMHDV
jgi:hypothetical protein